MKGFRIALALVAVAFIVGGGLAVFQGKQAYDQVKTNLVAQQIVTTPDSAIPNVAVDSADAAVAQADVIAVHASEAVKGMLGEDLTYAQIPHENKDGSPLTPDQPEYQARALLSQAASLRTSLYSAAMGFGLAQFVMAMGAALVALGGLGLAGVFALKQR